MFSETLNPYFAWAIARHCYEEELELPHAVLQYFATVATALIGEDTWGHCDPAWGANRDDRLSYERALRFDRQRKKREQYDDLKEIGSDRSAKWFSAEMRRLMSEEQSKGARTKDEIYQRIKARIRRSESKVKKHCLKAEKGEEFDRVLDRDFVDWLPRKLLDLRRDSV
jgi:hypothetical protein